MSAWVHLVGRLADAPQHRAFAGGGRYWLFFVETPRPTNPERTDTWTCTWIGDAADRVREFQPGQSIAVTGYLETYEKALGKQTVNLAAVRVLDARPLSIAGNGNRADQPAGKRGRKTAGDSSPEPAAVAGTEVRTTPAGRPGGADATGEAAGAQPSSQNGDRVSSSVPPGAIPMVKVDPSIFGLADDDEEDESRA